MALSGLSIDLQCFEIYNDEFHDLFSKKGFKQEHIKLKMKEQNKKLIIENLHTQSLESLYEF